MATLQELVDGLRDQVTGFATSLAQKLEELNAAKDGANAAAQAIDLKYANSFVAIGTRHEIFVDAVNGDDANSGLNAASPVRTAARVHALLLGGRENTIQLLSDLVIDHMAFIRTTPDGINYVGRTSDDSGFERRKLTFVDATNNVVFPGGLFLYSPASCGVTAYEVDIELAYTRNRNPINIPSGHIHVDLQNALITKTGTSVRHLFGGRLAGHFEVTDVVIDPSASGFIIQGVASGGDPNSLPGVSANFTQS